MANSKKLSEKKVVVEYSINHIKNKKFESLWANVTSKQIEKNANQWCKNNGYPIPQPNPKRVKKA